MFEEYQNNVLLAYQSKVDNGQLSHLLNISPALLREECLNIFKERYDPKKDNTSLRTFFGSDERAKGYLKIIDEFPTNKFRALVKFFRGEIGKPDRKNIELLAWLINFEPRPYQSGDPYQVSVNLPIFIKTDGIGIDSIKNSSESLNDEKTEKEKEILIIQGDTADEVISTSQPKKHNNNNKQLGISPKFNRAIIAFIATIIVVIGFYFIYIITKPQYMYWAGDHYEVLAYNKKINDVPIVPLDTFKLAHLKKITKPDTITKDSIEKIWYVKVNPDSIEFYTSKGEYPLDTNKILKPLSNHMHDKYILKIKN